MTISAPTHRINRLSLIIPAILFILIGIGLLAEPLGWTDLATAWKSLPWLPLIPVGGAVIGMIYFVLRGRRDRGIAAICLMVLFGAGCVVLLNEAAGRTPLNLMTGYPLFISAAGFALFFTFLLERAHERGIILPALLMVWAGGVGTVFTVGIFVPSVLTTVALLAPFGLILMAIFLFPSVLRRPIP
jgi:hypothetical protein